MTHSVTMYNNKGGVSKTTTVFNLGALDIELTPADLAELDQAVPPGAASGMRYPEVSMKAVNR